MLRAARKLTLPLARRPTRRFVTLAATLEGVSRLVARRVSDGAPVSSVDLMLIALSIFMVAGLLAAYCTMPTYESAVTHEGVAPFGLLVWLFYISKLYEVVDSLILALKGKHVSNLQSYHHAGAMWTMWSGTRYSAPGEWARGRSRTRARR